MLKWLLHPAFLALLIGGCRSSSSRSEQSYSVTLVVQNTSDDQLDVEFYSSTNAKVAFSVAPQQTETRTVSSRQEMEGADCNTSTGYLSIFGKSVAAIGAAGYRVQELGCAPEMTAKAVCSADKCEFELGKEWSIVPATTRRGI